MSKVFYRAPLQQYPIAAKGEGSWLLDKNGNKYLDGSGGAAVSTIGHGNRRVIEAIQWQAEQMAYAHTAFFSNDPQEMLAHRLAGYFHSDGAKVYFSSGGSEATETALKLTRQYHRARGENDRAIIISRQGSYHGATLGALGVSGTRRRTPYEPMLTDWPRIEPCYAYRHRQFDESEEAYGRRAANALERELKKVGSERVAAFIAEPVVGSTLGAVPAASGYFKRIREVCDEHGILLICDEVMSGAGRTGPYLASASDDARPDIVVLGKGLGAGYQPLGAVICKGSIHDTITEKMGAFEHGHTYIGHAIACAAGLAVLDEIEHENLLQRVEPFGREFRSLLREKLGEHPHVGEIRGRGLLCAVEFVEDKERKTPFSAARKFPAALRMAGMRNGLICYPDGGNVGGDGAHVLLAPAFNISSAELEELVDRLSRSISEVIPACAAA